MNIPLRRTGPFSARLKTVTAALLSLSLFVPMLSVTGGPAAPAAAAPFVAAPVEAGAVTGTVFQDFTTVGWELTGSPGPASKPVAGVAIEAFDALGVSVGTAMSATDGTYSIAVADANSEFLRVEFSGWEAPFEPAFAAQDATQPNASIGANDTSVRFVELDSSHSANNVDFGLVVPEHTAQINAPIATGIQSAGALNVASTKDLPSVVAQPWQMQGTFAQVNPSVSKVSHFGRTGSIWGAAYSRPANDLYIAASLKRMSAMGPLGLGGIYRVPDVLLPSGAAQSGLATPPENWIDVTQLPVSNAGNALADFGKSKLVGRPALGKPDEPKTEILAFKESGRVGIGGIAASLDGSRLFVANIADGDVYGLDISDAAVKPSSMYRIETPVAPTQVIWATEIYEGRLYIGYVDTGDTAPGETDPWKSAKVKGLKAYVASTPVAGITDPSAVTPSWENELSVDLGYDKGSNIKYWKSNTCVGSGKNKVCEPFDGQYPQVNQWNSWTDTWNSETDSPKRSVAMLGEKRSTDLHAYPQAILSSIAFDSEGYLNLGFLDRTSVQSGNRSLGAVTIDPRDVKFEGTKRLWTSITNGDTLVAAPTSVPNTSCTVPNPGDNYVLECAGKVGARDVRTASIPTGNGTQDPTFDNSQGPGGGEFFNDRRELGTEALGKVTQGDPDLENHNETTLGGVSTYPGMSEVASTVIDPLAVPYVNGLMWFNERNGAATRGIELQSSTAGEGESSFQKSGGLGDSALLAREAPVEIGNRVWLDADLNGRQDADEPAINGATVELWTADANGDPEFKIATRTTKTVDGQPGTYYFRSDDADVIASATQQHPFVPNGSYVLVFPQGAGAVALAGPNANHPGFADLTWNDLQRTSAEVDTDGTTVVNDSNPTVDTGRTSISVGGPGQNNHTYDAGWFGQNTYSLSKAFNPTSFVPAEGASYTFNVVQAKNFRGEDRLTGAGTDPQVSNVTATLTGTGDWKWASTQPLPFGYDLVIEEEGANEGGVTWDTPVTDNPQLGQVFITPARGEAARAQITATNQFGEFTVKKTVTGGAKSDIDAGVKFKLQYTLNGGEPTDAWVSQGEPLAVSELPVGTTVKFKEMTPIVTDPAVTGIDWGTPTLTADVPGFTGPDADGWYSFTIMGDNPNVTLNLTNRAEEAHAGFSIQKLRAGADEPEADRTFTFEYTIGDEPTVHTLGPIAGGEIATTVATIRVGAEISVREVPLVDSSAVKWEDPAWMFPAGLEVTPADGWYKFALPEQVGDPLQLTVTNQAVQKLTGFSVAKTVETTGNPNVAGKVYGFTYRLAPAPVAGTQPVFGADETFTLEAGNTEAFADLPVGTVVEVREDALVSSPDVSWASPVWTVDGAAATTVDGWTRFTLAQEDVSVAASVKNRPTEKTHFSLQKAFAGTGIGLVNGEGYDVEYLINDEVYDENSPNLVTLPGSGTTVALPGGALPVGTVVKLREVIPLPLVSGIEWGEPTWTDEAGDELTPDGDRWVTFEITEDSLNATLTVTNKPRLTTGGFQVKKTLVNADGVTVPAAYVLEYERDGAPQPDISLTAGATATVFDGIPEGATVKLREIAPDPDAAVTWATNWKINGVAVTPDGDDWVTFDITASTSVELEVTNTASQVYGSFQVGKAVTGDGVSLVPGDTPFTFRYTVDDGASQQVTATPDTDSAIIDGLKVGAQVTIWEVNYPQIPGISFGQNPKWTLDGIEQSDANPLTFEVTGASLAKLEVDNTATKLWGSFKIDKSITGTAADRVPNGAEFEVEYSTDGKTTWTALPTKLSKNNLSIESGEFLVGTVVHVREVAPAAGTDYEWGTPKFTIGNVVWGSEATFTIVEGVAPAATVLGLENPAKPLNGTFKVKKSVTGDFALSDTELKDLAFQVNWAGNGREGSILLNAANNWTAGPEGAEFPAGTEITLTEGEITGSLLPNVQFEGYRWLEGVPGVTVDGDTATLTVATGTPALLTVENEFIERQGTFGITKEIAGEFSITDDEIKDLTFTAQYSTASGERGTLTLNAAGGWKAASGRTFPTGTKVTLTELSVDQSLLPSHVQWSGYEWGANSPNVDVSENGRVAVITIGDDSTDDVPALTLTNSFVKLRGSFGVQKFVAGDFDLTDPELRNQSFVVDYSAVHDGTETNGTLTLTAAGGWFAAADDLLDGTVVTLTELTPTGLAPNVRWDGYRWLAAEGLVISDDGLSATLTIDSDRPIARFGVENTFSSLESGFSVEKVVEGDFALDSPELSDLTFTVPYTASNGDRGELELNQVGAWVATPGTDLPLGTEITVTEADVTGLPAYVKWGGYTWLDGEGYTVSQDGKTASFTLIDTEVRPALTLQNTFGAALGGFSLKKLVTGAAAEVVPDDLEFTVEYSSDGGENWLALPTVSKNDPVASSPTDIRLGTQVLLREVAPATVDGVVWGTPAFSGEGVRAGTADTLASLIVNSATTPVTVVLENPTENGNGQFQVTKQITGAGASLLKGDPVFTVEYTYEGQQAPGKFEVKAGETFASELIPKNTEVTITELKVEKGLVEGASWGTPVFVLADGTVVHNGSKITIDTDSVIELILENPTRPALPTTGAASLAAGMTLAVILGIAGLLSLMVMRVRKPRLRGRRRA